MNERLETNKLAVPLQSATKFSKTTLLCHINEEMCNLCCAGCLNLALSAINSTFHRALSMSSTPPLYTQKSHNFQTVLTDFPFIDGIYKSISE